MHRVDQFSIPFRKFLYADDVDLIGDIDELQNNIYVLVEACYCISTVVMCYDKKYARYLCQ